MRLDPAQTNKEIAAKQQDRARTIHKALRVWSRVFALRHQYKATQSQVSFAADWFESYPAVVAHRQVWPALEIQQTRGFGFSMAGAWAEVAAPTLLLVWQAQSSSLLSAEQTSSYHNARIARSGILRPGCRCSDR